jgi:PAS domain S-box-containing protein
VADPPVDIQKTLDALPAMVGYWDRNLRSRMANEAYADLSGRSVEAMRGIHIREFLGEELYERSRRHLDRALAGEPQLFDGEIRTPSGKVRYTQTSYIPDVDASGEARGFLALVTDVTERRRLETEVERSRQRLAEAEHLARLGSWEWDIASGKMNCSTGLFEIYGIRAEEFDPAYDAASSRYVHPDDRAFVEREMREAVESGAPVDFEYRIIRPDGRVRRLHSRAELIADADGRSLRLAGTAQDVTELRAAAEVLETASDLGRRAAALRHLPARPRPGQDLARLLTARQIEILSLVAEGFSNAEIASRLYLGESTVKWHVRKILRALGVSNRAQAVARYMSSAPV